MKSKQNQMHKDNWFKLDNAGKLYPSIASPRISTIYRLTAELKSEVNVGLLQEALRISAGHFPLFNVRLRKGVFWYFFEKVNEVPTVLKELYYPCTSINMKESQVIPYKVLYYKNRVHLEMSHAIADGHGSITFLKSILKNYYDLLQHVSSEEIAVNNKPDEQLAAEYAEDAFQQYYEKGVPSPPPVGKAFHFPFVLVPKGEYRVIYGTFSNAAFKALSKKHNTTQNKMMLCLYFETIQEYVLAALQEGQLKKRDILPIIINAPINLRSLFKSETLRNFFISITPSIDLRLGTYTREEILGYLDHYFPLCMNEKYLKRFISRNFRSQLFWHVRLIPLFIKNLLLPIIYNYYGESSYTSSISNLGAIQINEPWGDIVEKFMVLPPPSEGNLIKSVIITHGDISTISFGSLTDNKSIEKIFFRKLVSEGVDITLESNY